MVSKRKKKYSTGEGAQFVSRKIALKRLQLSLNDFRRLCIIKGIYPREPRNRKRAQKGQAGIKTLYHVKDIQFLLHEPIIWKLRDYKIFNKKVGRARAVRDFEKLKKYLDNHPTLKLDHIVKERYPTFVDAIRDLDDCLTLCFLFSTFPSLPHVPRDQSALCRRLTMEFLHVVIEAKALRKVFISIKGYYYQAEIKGETVTWIVPHHFAFEPQQKSEVDFKIMSIFVEFYTIMLGFINFRLYHGLNLHYPPRFSSTIQGENDKILVDEDVFVAERVSALNCSLYKSSNETIEEEIEIDSFNNEGSPEAIEEAKKEAEKVKNLKTLFKGLKFFLNREVPREPLVFIIRCFGGEVSWDKTLFVGATFDENDESITHHIVDRPSISNQYISRYYVQPQWVFDSVNLRELPPVNKYFMGEILPPHLSPFIDKERDQQYIPPEERALYEDFVVEQHKKDENNEEDSESNEESDGEGKVEHTEETVGQASEEDSEEEDKTEDTSKGSKKPKLSVSMGEVYKEEPWEKNKQEQQEYRLREKMVKKKYRKLYKSMMEGKKERKKEIWLLRKKRRLHDEKEVGEKKSKKGKQATGQIATKKTKKVQG